MINNAIIYAHRGSSAKMPENTMASFVCALEDGATGIELDVGLTKDNQVVIIHDSDISRVSNGSGKVFEKTYEELLKYDFSFKHKKYNGEKLPLLTDVLKLIKDENIVLNIEIKNHTPNSGLEELTLKHVKDFGVEDKIIYSSFSKESLDKVKSLKDDAKIALLYKKRMASPWEASDGNYFAIHPKYSIAVKDHLIKDARKLGVGVNVWTVDNVFKAEKLLIMGATGIITNKPRLMKTLLV